jgi:hypothetical protein
MKVWLDDLRQAPDGWTRVYTVPELVALIESGEVTEVSLDHDLGEDEETGYDFLRWLEEQVFTRKVSSVPVIKIHSANSVGRKNMELAIGSIKRIIDKG